MAKINAAAGQAVHGYATVGGFDTQTVGGQTRHAEGLAAVFADVGVRHAGAAGDGDIRRIAGHGERQLAAGAALLDGQRHGVGEPG